MGDKGYVWWFGDMVKSPMCAGLSLRPTGCMLALSVTQSTTAAAVFSSWHNISDGLSHFSYH